MGFALDHSEEAKVGSILPTFCRSRLRIERRAFFQDVVEILADSLTIPETPIPKVPSLPLFA
jgi:hypothetical protein